MLQVYVLFCIFVIQNSDIEESMKEINDYRKSEIRSGEIINFNGEKLLLVEEILEPETFIREEVLGEDSQELLKDEQGEIIGVTPVWAEFRSDPVIWAKQKWFVLLIEPTPFKSKERLLPNYRYIEFKMGNYKMRTRMADREVVNNRKLTTYPQPGMEEEYIIDKFLTVKGKQIY